MEPCPSPGVFFYRIRGQINKIRKFSLWRTTLCYNASRFSRRRVLSLAGSSAVKPAGAARRLPVKFILRRKHHGIGYAPHGGYY